jgi:hypothetical protein
MTVFLILAGSLTCGFFLYVLLQFHKDLRRRELHSSQGRKPRRAHSPTLRFRSRRGSGGRGFEAAASVKLLVPRDT